MMLALDLSSFTGWAVGKPGIKPRFDTLRLPSTGDDIGRFAEAYDTWLRDMLAAYPIDRIVFETSVLPRMTTPMTVRKLTGLTWHTEFVARKLGIICNEINLATVKKFWAGSGHAKKPDMIAAAKRYGFPVTDDNQADALGLWHLACERIQPGINPWMSLGALGAKP